MGWSQRDHRLLTPNKALTPQAAPRRGDLFRPFCDTSDWWRPRSPTALSPATVRFAPLETKSCVKYRPPLRSDPVVTSRPLRWATSRNQSVLDLSNQRTQPRKFGIGHRPFEHLRVDPPQHGSQRCPPGPEQPQQNHLSPVPDRQLDASRPPLPRRRYRPYGRVRRRMRQSSSTELVERFPLRKSAESARLRGDRL